MENINIYYDRANRVRRHSTKEGFGENKIIMIEIDGKPEYFSTSLSRAGKILGLGAGSIKWALKNGTKFWTNKDDKKINIYMVDGSDILYKYIDAKERLSNLYPDVKFENLQVIDIE